MRYFITAVQCIAILGTLIGCESEQARTQRLLDEAKPVDAQYDEAYAKQRGTNNGVLIAQARENRQNFHAMPTQKRLETYRRAVQVLMVAEKKDVPLGSPRGPKYLYRRSVELEYEDAQRALDKEILRGMILEDWSAVNEAATRYRRAKERRELR